MPGASKGMECSRDVDIAQEYELGHVIGRGSFGTVHAAVRRSDQQSVVIKEVQIHSLNEAERACALREAETLSQLQHANIIQYHETRSYEGAHAVGTSGPCRREGVVFSSRCRPHQQRKFR
jgi:serine/threonine protein kinase